MAIIKTLVRSLTRRNCDPRSSLLLIPSLPFSRLLHRLERLLLLLHPPPHLAFSAPLHGCCLSSPPPLYLKGKDAIFPSDLLRVRSFPIELGFRGGDGGLISGGGGVEKVEIEDRFLNLPNLILISRGASGPLIGWMIINEWYLPAFCGLAISGATDLLDGFLARKMGINSVFGSYLDPLADKVLIASVALAMVKQDLLHLEELVRIDAWHREKVVPLFISKVNTAFQLLFVAGALLQPVFGTEETQLYIKFLSWLVASTTIASSATHGGQHLCSRSALAVRKQ